MVHVGLHSDFLGGRAWEQNWIFLIDCDRGKSLIGSRACSNITSTLSLCYTYQELNPKMVGSMYFCCLFLVLPLGGCNISQGQTIAWGGLRRGSAIIIAIPFLLRLPIPIDEYRNLQNLCSMQTSCTGASDTSFIRGTLPRISLHYTGS